MRKVHFGFYNAKSSEEIAAHARETYEAYYRNIRELVPPERRLEYEMGDGWGPLCAFLGLEVPKDVPSPRENDKDEHGEEAEARLRKFRMSLFKVSIPSIVGLAAVATAWTYIS